ARGGGDRDAARIERGAVRLNPRGVDVFVGTALVRPGDEVVRSAPDHDRVPLAIARVRDREAVPVEDVAAARDERPVDIRKVRGAETVFVDDEEVGPVPRDVRRGLFPAADGDRNAAGVENLAVGADASSVDAV